MTIAEIFQKINSHQIEGLMTHEQLANYFDFLNLRGFMRLHEYHYLEESISMREICRYHMSHFNKLISYESVSNPDIIPSAWFSKTRFDVDMSTRKRSVMTGFDKWKAWESETKKLYEELYSEACSLGEIAAAAKIKTLICDVDDELKIAEEMCLELKSVDYDPTYVIDIQKCLYDKYDEKAKGIGIS